MSDSSVQREKKVINLKSSSSSSSSLVLDIIFTLIGSLPMIIIAIISEFNGETIAIPGTILSPPNNGKP